MRMPDGGFRPAFNVQFATTTDPARVSVGVSVPDRGSDQGQATPMREQIEARTGVRPTELLIDDGYPSHDAIDQATAAGVPIYAPVRAAADPRQPPHNVVAGTADSRSPAARRTVLTLSGRRSYWSWCPDVTLRLTVRGAC